MDDDVSSVLKGTAEIGRGEGVVHDERHAVFVRESREAFDVEHCERGVGNGFAENGPGFRAEGLLNLFVGGALIHEGHADAEALQRHAEQVESAAVNGGARYNVIAGFADGGDGGQRSCLARGGEECADASLEGRDFLLNGVHGGIAEARVEESVFRQVEELGHFGGGLVAECGGLDNGEGTGLAVFRLVSGVDALGFEFHD